LFTGLQRQGMGNVKITFFMIVTDPDLVSRLCREKLRENTGRQIHITHLFQLGQFFFEEHLLPALEKVFFRGNLGKRMAERQQ
jgi:hypothetical protein